MALTVIQPKDRDDFPAFFDLDQLRLIRLQYEILNDFPSFVISIGKDQVFPSGSRKMTLVFFV